MAKVAVEVAGKMAAHAVADVAEHAAEDVVAHAAEDVGEKVAESCLLSFSPDTRVATPSGGVAIASLHIGDHVTAYDPATGKTSTQTVQHVWINHDTDLLDVTLRVADAHAPATNDAKQHRVALVGHGPRAPPIDQGDLTKNAEPALTIQNETVRTTAKHPWLTTDHGFVKAGTLFVGEQVVREDGAPATVVAVAVRPGATDYYNLTVSNLHTYAVSSGQYVVHNCSDPFQAVRKIAKANIDDSLADTTTHAPKDYLKHGWTRDEVEHVIENGEGQLTADLTEGGKANPQRATRFTDPDTGRAVTVNNATGSIKMLGGADYLYDFYDTIARDLWGS